VAEPRPAVVTLTSAGPDDTQRIAERFARDLGPGAVVALTGELGAGKTCFVQGLVRGLGVATRATSPTFVLVNEYHGRLAVHHVDAYRVAGPAEMVDIGLAELIDADGVTIIEWADRIASLLPARTVHVHLDGLGDDPRTITIRRPADASVSDPTH
jgi:tRNA threonylcarbamoyladenosine biosynthesis protein TsaE